MKILISGTAGFIGYSLVDSLISEKVSIFGIDVINEYYDINLKITRLKQHGIIFADLIKNQITKSSKYENYNFIFGDICNDKFINDLFLNEKFDVVINLAAQAGVRYSIDNPKVYARNNIDGFLSILEGCRKTNVGHLIYASTSSVYGLNSATPFNENDYTEHPVSFYAATKKANEAMAHSYSHLYSLPTTGLRFFTVYGPWGRPDMALFLFVKAILAGEEINVFNNGNMYRDFTYIDDIVESIKRVIKIPPKLNSTWNLEDNQVSESSAPYRILNIGNGNSVSLMEYVREIERAVGLKAKINYQKLQKGDVLVTSADISKLASLVHYKPKTNIKEGVSFFVDWYKKYLSNDF